MILKSASGTDIGQVREINQDSLVCNDKLKLYVVADGLGGHVGGEVASKMAADLMTHAFSKTRRSFEPAKYLTKTVQQANRSIYYKSDTTPSLKGMGTTLTAIYLSYDTAYIAHVGDSRAYLIVDGMIWQLSEDHSLAAQEMVGAVSKPLKNIITRSVGFDREVEVDIYTKKISDGDHYLLCSDGLHGFVKDEEISEVVSNNALDQVPQRLIDLANDRGGGDNITAVVVKVERV